MITNLSQNLTETLTSTKKETSDKLDMLLNPEKARQQKVDKEKAMKDIRDAGHDTVSLIKYILPVSKTNRSMDHNRPSSSRISG